MGSENRTRLAFAGLLAATLLAFSQLFDGPYLGPPLLAALLSAASTIAARRLGLGNAGTLGLSGLGLGWYLSVVFSMPTLLYGVPTPGALGSLGASLRNALVASSLDFAPVPPRPGYVILLTAALWISAGLAEVATFRWRQPLVAALPPLGLFAFVLVVGTGEGTWFFLSLFLSGLFWFWASESSHRTRSWGRWVSAFSQDDKELASPTASVARRMGASCVALAIVAPLVLPGMQEGLLAWRTGGASGGIGPGVGGAQGINLLVSLAPTLAEQSSRELFVVEADAPTYWRLTSLARFDGRDWTAPPHNLVPLEDGEGVSNFQFPPSPIPPQRLTKVSQRYEITGLGSEVLPAATHPSYISPSEATGLGYDDLSVDVGTGEIRLRSGLTPGLRYSIDSLVPRVSFEALGRAPLADPGPIYTQLPAGISPQVRALARHWTERADTPFQKLVAIQDHLRAFEYSLAVTPEDSADHLTRFLTEVRRGYCQQFATAFAVLARILDIPTRVSVGFLPGAPSTTRPDTYVVSGTDAHAWPEVYFEDYGWVAFEPTPRSSAQQPTYTLPASNAIGRGGPSGGTDSPSSATTGIRARLRNEALAGARGLAGRLPGSTEGSGLRDLAWVKAFNRLAGALALLAALFLGTMPLLKEWRTATSYRRADSPTRAARAAFRHFEREAGDLAIARRRSESGLAFARRLVGARPAARADALALARICEAAEYSARGVTSAQARQARILARRLRRALWTSASWWQRGRRLFSPVGLMGSTRAGDHLS